MFRMAETTTNHETTTEITKLLQISIKLDAAMLEYLDLVSKYEEQWKCISKELESGFMSIAHAKYIMGPSSLSQRQYDGRMQATGRVLVSSPVSQSPIDDTHLSDFSSSSNDKNYDNYTLSLVNGTFHQLERDPLVSNIVNSETIQSNRLRQRVNGSKNSLAIMETAQQDHSDNNDTSLQEKHESVKKFLLKDPLIWFGLLVPKSLREAQMRFNQGLREMINLINLKNEIWKKEREVEGLKKEKEILRKMLSKTNNRITGDNNLGEEVKLLTLDLEEFDPDFEKRYKKFLDDLYKEHDDEQRQEEEEEEEEEEEGIKDENYNSEEDQNESDFSDITEDE
ncbi:hypothetical protein G9A89_019315 [Geosiphon pyriformis]|nr:hypothetical protein G9A89_019315 [Geosiphon pyriformis]